MPDCSESQCQQNLVAKVWISNFKLLSGIYLAFIFIKNFVKLISREKIPSLSRAEIGIIEFFREINFKVWISNCFQVHTYIFSIYFYKKFREIDFTKKIHSLELTEIGFFSVKLISKVWISNFK